MKAPYSCRHCGEDFTVDGEPIYAIWPLVLKKGEDGDLHWAWRSKENSDYLFFHDSCFEEIAGKLYMVPDKDDEV